MTICSNVLEPRRAFAEPLQSLAEPLRAVSGAVMGYDVFGV